jgi:hypothetical protein
MPPSGSDIRYRNVFPGVDLLFDLRLEAPRLVLPSIDKRTWLATVPLFQVRIAFLPGHNTKLTGALK